MDTNLLGAKYIFLASASTFFLIDSGSLMQTTSFFLLSFIWVYKLSANIAITKHNTITITALIPLISKLSGFIIRV